MAGQKAGWDGNWSKAQGTAWYLCCGVMDEGGMSMAKVRGMWIWTSTLSAVVAAKFTLKLP